MLWARLPNDRHLAYLCVFLFVLALEMGRIDAGWVRYPRPLIWL